MHCSHSEFSTWATSQILFINYCSVILLLEQSTSSNVVYGVMYFVLKILNNLNCLLFKLSILIMFLFSKQIFSIIIFSRAIVY